jgi:hypothetical protein
MVYGKKNSVRAVPISYKKEVKQQRGHNVTFVPTAVTPKQERELI